MNEKPNYYAVIPANVRYDKDLRPNEKLLYGEITALASKTGSCWANNEYFSILYDVKPNAVATWIRHLKEKDYIIVDYEYEKGTKEIKKRIISIGDIQKDTTSYPKEYGGGIQKDNRGGIQKGEDNNTSNINNTSNNNKKEIYKEICERVITRLNELNNTKYSTKSEGNIKFIKGRLEEGYTEDDLLLVVDKMSYLWNQPNEKDMKQYLRPSTLFRPTNFENYLNMPVKEKKLTTRDLASKIDFTDFLEKGRIK